MVLLLDRWVHLSVDDMLYQLIDWQLIRLGRNHPTKENFKLVSFSIREQRDTSTGIKVVVEFRVKGKLNDQFFR